MFESSSLVAKHGTLNDGTVRLRVPRRSAVAFDYLNDTIQNLEIGPAGTGTHLERNVHQEVCHFSPHAQQSNVIWFFSVLHSQDCEFFCLSGRSVMTPLQDHLQIRILFVFCHGVWGPNMRDGCIMAEMNPFASNRNSHFSLATAEFSSFTV